MGSPPPPILSPREAGASSREVDAVPPGPRGARRARRAAREVVLGERRAQVGAAAAQRVGPVAGAAVSRGGRRRRGSRRPSANAYSHEASSARSSAVADRRSERRRSGAMPWNRPRRLRLEREDPQGLTAGRIRPAVGPAGWTCGVPRAAYSCRCSANGARWRPPPPGARSRRAARRRPGTRRWWRRPLAAAPRRPPACPRPRCPRGRCGRPGRCRRGEGARPLRGGSARWRSGR